MSGCTPACGPCGRCTEAWEATPEEVATECIHCGGKFLPEDTGFQDYCSDSCSEAEEGCERDDF